jgi:hemoglobin-like flavoprotein
VGATLLASLEEVAGDLWNDDLQKAWSDAYGVVSQTMLTGAAKHQEKLVTV